MSFFRPRRRTPTRWASMPTVFVLQHLRVYEDGREDVKLIGVFGARSGAMNAISQLRDKPGFRDAPRLVNPLGDDDESGFHLNERTVDQFDWADGFGVD